MWAGFVPYSNAAVLTMKVLTSSFTMLSRYNGGPVMANINLLVSW